MPSSQVFKLKRAYEPATPEDGSRILVERLWPRGVTKTQAGLDMWLKDIAPSTELRKWFDHDPAKWAAFQERYTAELRTHPDLVEQLLQKAREGTVTLVYGARDEEHNAAIVLRAFLIAQPHA
ncbi:MAG TPA: DUF488 domain-containing protein [Devosiaceae bacterium]|jgi:uncharacterized protein YeaO (DUF488 family)